MELKKALYILLRKEGKRTDIVLFVYDAFV